MHPLEAAIVDMIVAADHELGDQRAFGRAIRAAVAARSSCDESTARAAMARLAAALPKLHRRTIPMIAMWCGELARLGADPEPCTPELIDWLLEQLSYAVVFRQAWKKNAADPEWAGAGLPAEPPIKANDIVDANVRQLYEGIAEVLPDEAWSWEELGMLCTGLQTLAARSLALRRRMRETDLLVEALHTVAPGQPKAADLLALLRVADEEPLLVLHPEHRRGYRVTITRVSQNSQLEEKLSPAAEEWLGRIQDSKRDPAKTAPEPEEKIDTVIIDCELPQVKRGKRRRGQA